MYTYVYVYVYVYTYVYVLDYISISNSGHLQFFANFGKKIAISAALENPWRIRGFQDSLVIYL